MRNLPNIIAPLNPVGIDLAIKGKQDGLATLTYNKNGLDVPLFDAVWGIAQRDEDNNKPILRLDDRDYFSPETDNYGAICFFRESEERKYSGRVIYNCDLYVMLVNSYFSNDESIVISLKEHIINKVVNFLRRDVEKSNRLEISVTTDTHEVFRPYSIDIKGYFKHPFDNFRVSFTDSYSLDCNAELEV